ncbi:MAG: (d)CMP kinase [Bacteroidaceae bacterium]|jgi:cytidylate kinase|nr:(d)CMP kinase [Bacteroidaceae bacterium]MDO4201456.1 (d)CMP kinase [Bacteroidales bacterium]
MKKIIIAIDGHSSCGKSTMAKQLAKDIGYVYVDTGAMYRAVTLYAMRNGMYPDAGIQEEELKAAVEAGKIQISFKFNAETGRPDTYLNGEKVEDEIRQMEVSNRVSPVAALPFVRALLTQQQQEMGKEKGIVMDGRDIGTAVFPQAEMKVFVTASARVRAQRRFDELMGKAKTQEELAALNYEEVLKNVEERDYIDSHREVAPLRQAEDALVLDNSDMTREEQSAWLLAKYQEIVAKC